MEDLGMLLYELGVIDNPVRYLPTLVLHSKSMNP